MNKSLLNLILKKKYIKKNVSNEKKEGKKNKKN